MSGDSRISTPPPSPAPDSTGWPGVPCLSVDTLTDTRRWGPVIAPLGSAHGAGFRLPRGRRLSVPGLEPVSDGRGARRTPREPQVSSAPTKQGNRVAGPRLGAWRGGQARLDAPRPSSRSQPRFSPPPLGGTVTGLPSGDAGSWRCPRHSPGGSDSAAPWPSGLPPSSADGRTSSLPKLSAGQRTAGPPHWGGAGLTGPPWSVVRGAGNVFLSLTSWVLDSRRGAAGLRRGGVAWFPSPGQHTDSGAHRGAQSGVYRNVASRVPTHPGPGTPQRAPRGLRALPRPWRRPWRGSGPFRAPSVLLRPPVTLPLHPRCRGPVVPALPTRCSRILDSALLAPPPPDFTRLSPFRCAPQQGEGAERPVLFGALETRSARRPAGFQCDRLDRP